MKLILLSSVILGIASASYAIIEMPLSDEMTARVIAAGTNEFALDMYREVSGLEEEGNIFFSPYSVSMTLGMVYGGARGNTALDMSSVLHFNLPVEAVNTGFQLLTKTISFGRPSELETGDPFTMAISNGLWVQQDYELLDDFVSAVREFYGASVESLDFIGDTEGSRETINSWVARNTMNKILNLIPFGVLDTDTRVVLTNAVYFKASWTHPFNLNATSDRRFILEDGSEVVVPMMTNTDSYRYASSDDWSAVVLDYAGGDAGMLVIMPTGDMGEFQEGFDAELLAAVRSSMSSRNLHLSMPRFEFTRSMPLSTILRSLGMESAFDSSADFSGITGNRDLYISEVLHKAYVKVDETGTEAAAATALTMATTGMPAPPAEMNINRPFVFIIQNNLTGSIVFMGRVMNPSV